MKIKNYIIAIIALVGISFAFSGCVNQEFEEPDSTCSNEVIPKTISLHDLKTIFNNGTGDTIRLNDSIVLEAYVTSCDLEGNFYKELVVQDSTDAISLMIDASYLYTKFPLGQKVYIKCGNLLIGKTHGAIKLGSTYTEYGITNFGRIQGQAVIDEHIIKTCDKELVEPEVITLNQVGPNFNYKLVKIENVQFKYNEMGTTWADGANLESVNNYIVDENGNSLIVRTSGYAKFANDTLPSGNGTIVGILQKYDTDYQLLVRSVEDADMKGTRFTEPIFFDFESGDIFSDGWTNQIVKGVAWTIGDYDNYAQCKNWNGSENVETESWFISPNFDLSSFANPVLSFTSAWGYDGADIKAKYSVDYDGVSEPSSATWTDLSPNFYSGSTFWTWTNSGELSIPNAESIHVAIVYYGSSSSGRTWEVDDVLIDDSAK